MAAAINSRATLAYWTALPSSAALAARLGRRGREQRSKCQRFMHKYTKPATMATKITMVAIPMVRAFGAGWQGSAAGPASIMLPIPSASPLCFL
jgi:hypothetical protein